nr:unnamed protein product [Callosobruchus analis]
MKYRHKVPFVISDKFQFKEELKQYGEEVNSSKPLIIFKGVKDDIRKLNMDSIDDEIDRLKDLQKFTSSNRSSEVGFFKLGTEMFQAFIETKYLMSKAYDDVQFGLCGSKNILNKIDVHGIFFY